MFCLLARAVLLRPDYEERLVLLAGGRQGVAGDQGAGAGQAVTHLSAPAGSLTRTGAHQHLPTTFTTTTTTTLTPHKAPTVLSVSESVCGVEGSLRAGGYSGT